MRNFFTRQLQNERGMALLLSLLLLSLILVATMQFNTSMRASLSNAANLQDGVTLDYMARSAFNAVRAVLAVDFQESDHDSLQEDWAQLSEASQYLAYFFSRGGGELAIEDHSGRIQLNSLLKKKEDGEWEVREERRKVLLQLLTQEEFDLSEEEADSIIDAIVDWIDTDDETYGFGGAESSYYQSLDRPYSPRNGPMQFIEELLLIRGISRDLFYGSEEIAGLGALLTPHGIDGKININTADPLVLLSLSDQLDQDMVDGMLDYREAETADLHEADWYKYIGSIPSDVTLPADMLTTVSSFFEITAEVKLDKMSKRIKGMVSRGAGSRTEIVYWKME